MMNESSEQNILSIRNLKTWFYTYEGVVHALDGVNLDITSKSVLGVVGETGCGKSITALSILNLVPRPGRIVEGSVVFEGRDLLKLDDTELRSVRGRAISMIFQRPAASLNPVVSVGSQLESAIRLHSGADREEAFSRAVRMLEMVGLPDPERQLKKYPHEMSGGMLQRIMIAIALSSNPRLLIADEPATALDVTIQAQVLEVMRRLSEELGTTIMMITHDLGIVAEMCDTVAVMYAGRIVERAPVQALFERPLHPYSRGLLESLPVSEKGSKLPIIPGTVCSMIDPPAGCRFHPRCPSVMDICRKKEPPVRRPYPGHETACHLY